MLNVMRRLAWRYAVLVALTALVLGAFQFIVAAVTASLDMNALIGGVLALLPPGLGSALAQQVFGGLDAHGLLAFGWNHPIVHAAGGAAAVVFGAHAIAGEIENGTLELVLAQPLARGTYLGANLLFAIATLALICAAGVLGTLVGARVYALDAPPLSAVAAIAANLLLLLVALHAIALLASAFGREGGRALGIGFMVTVTSFLVYTVALLWPAAAALEPYTLHAYYEPRDVLATGAIPLRSVAVLGSVSLLALGTAMWRFRTRDVP
jgi:ABC-2 type transport system permease protein